MKRIVLAFSGDVDGAAAIPWLLETARAEIVTVTLDVGLGRDPADVRERALALGAVRAHVLDARDAFAIECLVPALRAGALADVEGATAGDLVRPLLARQLVDVARLERATIVAHACTGAARKELEALVRAIDPALVILAPADNWHLTTADKLASLRERGLPDFSAESEAGLPLEAPDTPASVDLAFENGVPVEISGVPMNVAELIQCLDTIAGGHGVGRKRGHGVPALIVLHAACQALQETIGPADPVSGLVRVELFKGACRVVGRHVMA